MPPQTERANANLQLQIANLRANASRLPKPLARMVNAAADDFEGDAAETSIAAAEPDAGRDRQPTLRGGDRQPLSLRRRRRRGRCRWSDFAQLFAPSGVIDRFFAQNLAPLVDMSGAELAMEAGHAAWPRAVQVGFEELSSLPPKSAMPSFRWAARCRRSTSPSRPSRCTAMPTWRCSTSMARSSKAIRPATRRASSTGLAAWRRGAASLA